MLDSSPQLTSLLDLPTEIILRMLSLLPNSTLCNISQSSQHCNKLVYQTSLYAEISISDYKKLQRLHSEHLCFALFVKNISFDIKSIMKSYLQQQIKQQQQQHEQQQQQQQQQELSSTPAEHFSITYPLRSSSVTFPSAEKTLGEYDDYFGYADNFSETLLLLVLSRLLLLLPVHDAPLPTSTQSLHPLSTSSLNINVIQLPLPSELMAEILVNLPKLATISLANITRDFSFQSFDTTNNNNNSNASFQLQTLTLSSTHQEHLSLHFDQMVPTFISSVETLSVDHFLIGQSTIVSSFKPSPPQSTLTSTSHRHIHPFLPTIRSLKLNNIQFSYSSFSQISTILPNLKSLVLQNMQSLFCLRIIDHYPNLEQLAIDFNAPVFLYFNQFNFGYDFYHSSFPFSITAATPSPDTTTLTTTTTSTDVSTTANSSATADNTANSSTADEALNKNIILNAALAASNLNPALIPSPLPSLASPFNTIINNITEYYSYDEVKISYFLTNFINVFSPYFVSSIASHPGLKVLDLINVKFLNLFVKPMDPNEYYLSHCRYHQAPTPNQTSTSAAPTRATTVKDDMRSYQASHIQGFNLFRFFKLISHISSINFHLDDECSNYKSTAGSLSVNENDWLSILDPIFMASSCDSEFGDLYDLGPKVSVFDSKNDMVFLH